jgi:hypothetical protein
MMSGNWALLEHVVRQGDQHVLLDHRLDDRFGLTGLDQLLAQSGLRIQGWRMAFLYNLPVVVSIPKGASVLPA